ncbi:SipW-dependent-type signal peptide-containing protein [Citricoccus sp. NPDC079358]|uniref:SipW-dependent-type signal peptide-containing protein n=1 Tax=Citricoccus sp. NPDC079358 TaxID=3154653 RepID=UPI00344D581C
MRITAQLKAAALIGLAAVVGLLGVGGTWALWNAVVPSAAGTVQAADFKITLNEADMAVAGTAVQVTPAGPSGPLTPGAPVYAALTVANHTDAGTPMPVIAAVAAPRITQASVPALKNALTAQVSAPTSGDCTQARYTEANTGTSATIPQDESRRFCLRMSLRDGASTTLRGQCATVAVDVTATQQSPGA